MQFFFFWRILTLSALSAQVEQTDLLLFVSHCLFVELMFFFSQIQFYSYSCVVFHLILFIGFKCFSEFSRSEKWKGWKDLHQFESISPPYFSHGFKSIQLALLDVAMHNSIHNFTRPSNNIKVFIQKFSVNFLAKVVSGRIQKHLLMKKGSEGTYHSFNINNWRMKLEYGMNFTYRFLDLIVIKLEFDCRLFCRNTSICQLLWFRDNCEIWFGSRSIC